MTPRLTIPDLHRAKVSNEPIVMITAYDQPTARLVDQAGVDMVLVGDSAAMVVLGRKSTNEIGMSEMLLFSRAVSDAVERAFVVGDMPFMSYQTSDAVAIGNAGRFIAEGRVDAVKLEGGGAMIDRVRAITSAGIAVVGHLGLTPQSAGLLGGYRAQARTAERAQQLVEDALALEEAGAIAIVLEAIPPTVAERVTEQLSIPTIGIGAGVGTDGQVLVLHDLLGIDDARAPRFVRRYANIGAEIQTAVAAYTRDVRARTFPASEHTYTMPDEEARDFAQPQFPHPDAVTD